jgi:putative ABC transport system permease protein
LLTESVLLSLLGGLGGLLLSLWGVQALLALSPADLPRLDEVNVDARVLLFTLAVALLTGALFGLAPALRALKLNLTQSLRESSRSVAGAVSSHRLGGVIVITEIALSLILLVGAGLVMRSFLRLLQVDPGFSPRNVLTMKMALPRAKYVDGAAAANFYQRLIANIQALPGVESDAAVSQLPLSNDYWSGTVTFEGVTANAERGNLASFETDQRIITPDYFQTMKTPLLEGRPFTPQDARGKPFVAIIDETLARRLWPNASPVGHRITFGRYPDKPEVWVEIVGVARHIRHHRLDGEVREQIYYPHAQRPFTGMTLAIRTKSDPMAMVGAVRGVVRSIDRDQPVYLIRTMDGLVSNALAPARFTLLLLTIFAIVAAALATVGVYGVMSQAVAQRTHEIGVRLALGAQRRDVLRLVIKQGMALALPGVAIGLLASFTLTGLIRGLLFGITATDPLTFATIALLLLLIALLACFIPALRATKVDPVIALRFE